MSYRPDHTLIIVVNADGSGYARQFSTMAEAKEAYKTISTDGVAFLYPSAKKSRSSLDGSDAIPEYNNGTTYGTGDKVRFQGNVYQLINFIGAAGYTPASHPSLWTNNVILPKPLPPISSTGFTDGSRKGMSFTAVQNVGFGPCPTVGTVLQSGLNADFSIQINGIYYVVGNATYNIVADGNCGTTQPNTSLTFVPSGTLLGSQGIYNYFSDGDGGFYEDHAPDPDCPSAGTILDQANSSPIIISVSGRDFEIGTTTFNVIADGNCGSTQETTGTTYLSYATFVTSDEIFNYYSDGVGYVFFEPKLTGYEGEEFYITVGLNEVVSKTRTRQKFANDTFGEWSEWNYTPYGTSYGSDSTYNYYADGYGSYYTEDVTGGCDGYGTYISSESGEYIVNFGCGDFVSGDWSNSFYADGNCGTYSDGYSNYVSNGTLLGNCNDYNYYADGNGGYYQGEFTGGNGCTSYGTWLNGSNSDIYTANPCGGDWIVGQSYYSEYADGNCGSYYESGNNYYQSGQLVGNCNDYNYYSNGEGGIYQGEYTGSGGGGGYPSYGEPTGNSGSSTNYIDINGTQYENGTYSYTEYHDGMGGTYTDSSTSYAPYETYFGSQSYYDYGSMADIYTYYYSDGNGGYYTSS